MGPGDVFTPNGGYFTATNYPLVTYISFAYKLMGNQAQFLRPQLPGWVTTERFDIQARAEGNPGKDEMRLMMRSLSPGPSALSFANQHESREVPPPAMVFAKPLDTQLQLRSIPRTHLVRSSLRTQPGSPEPSRVGSRHFAMDSSRSRPLRVGTCTKADEM